MSTEEEKVTPTTASREDLLKAVEEVMGKAAAESIREIQVQAQKAIDGVKDAQVKSAAIKGPVVSGATNVESKTTKSGITLTYHKAGLTKASHPGLLPLLAQDGVDSEVFHSGLVARMLTYRGLQSLNRWSSEFTAEQAAKAGHKVTAKALAQQTLADGGALIPPEFSAEIIDALRPAAKVRAAGPDVWPMNAGNITVAFVNPGTTAYYNGENLNATVSQPTFGQYTMTAKKLIAVVPSSNDLLRNGGPRVESTLRRDMLRAVAQREDLAFLRGDGSSFTPKGMRNWAYSSNVVAQTATPDIIKITKDLALAISRVVGQNVDVDSGHWFLSHREFYYLLSLRTTNGEYAFPEMQEGMLLGYPVSFSTQIPITLGGGTESEVLFVNMNDIVIGQNESMLVEVFPGGAYYDGSQIVSGISTDQTVFKLTEQHDMMARYNGKEISVITGVTWGA